MTRHASTSALDPSSSDVVTQGGRGVHIAADLKDAGAKNLNDSGRGGIKPSRVGAA
jgi:hypothetical protein